MCRRSVRKCRWSQTGVFERSILTFFEIWMNSLVAFVICVTRRVRAVDNALEQVDRLELLVVELRRLDLAHDPASFMSAPVGGPATATPVTATVAARATTKAFREFLNNFFPPQKSRRAHSRAGSGFCTHCGATCPGGMSVNTAKCDKLRLRLVLLMDSQGLGRVDSGWSRSGAPTESTAGWGSHDGGVMLSVLSSPLKAKSPSRSKKSSASARCHRCAPGRRGRRQYSGRVKALTPAAQWRVSNDCDAAGRQVEERAWGSDTGSCARSRGAAHTPRSPRGSAGPPCGCSAGPLRSRNLEEDVLASPRRGSKAR